MNDLINKTGFTKYPNVLMDLYMKELSPIAFKLLSVICRKTIGFNKSQDKISLSIFKKYTGVSKASVVKGLNELIDKKLIIKSKNITTNIYELNLDVLQQNQIVKTESVQKLNQGLIAVPEYDQILNRQTVQDLNTQKTPFKKNEIKSSTTFFSNDVFKVAEEWTTRFDNNISKSDTHLLIQIEERLKQFSVQQLIEAMDNRLKADYYKYKKPELLHLPTCFFNYPETIQNDLKRGVKRLYTYDEKNALVASQGYLDSSFELKQDKHDSLGRGLWELKS